MTFEDLITALAVAEDFPETVLRDLLGGWDEYGPRCRALLHLYVTGRDFSETTEKALVYVVHLLGEKEETGSFADLCALARDAERFESVLDDEAAAISYPCILVSTFGDDPAPLYALIEDPAAEQVARGDGLLVLAYLARTGRLAERSAYDYLAGLPARLRPEEENFVWFGYARAVAALGFGGLSAAVESMIGRGLVTSDLMSSADFWADLRECQQNPQDFSHPLWNDIGPMGSAIAQLGATYEFEGSGSEDFRPDYVAQPLRNPLRNIGRNDPCPCGSGKKFKKCCIEVDPA